MSEVIINLVPDTSKLEEALANLDTVVPQNLAKNFEDVNKNATAAHGSVANLSGKIKDIQTTVTSGALKNVWTDFKKGAEESETKLGGLTAQLREARSELGGLINQQRQGKIIDPVVMDAAILKVKGLEGSLRQMQATTRNGLGLQALASGASTVAGAFSAASGVTAIWGEKSEDLQKSMLKVQGALALTNGIQAIATNLQKENVLVTTIQTYANLVWAGSLGIARQALRLVGIESEATAVALRGALVVSGIGIVLVAVTLLIDHFDELKQAMSGLTKEQQELQEVQKTSFDAYTKEAVVLQTLVKTAGDVTATYGARKEAVDTIHEKYKGYLDDLTTDNATSKDIADTINNEVIPALKAKAEAQAAESFYTDALKEQFKVMTEGAGFVSDAWNTTINAILNGGDIATAAVQTQIDNNKKAQDKVAIAQKIFEDAQNKSNKFKPFGVDETEQQLIAAKTIADSKVKVTIAGTLAEFNAKKAAFEADRNLALYQNQQSADDDKVKAAKLLQINNEYFVNLRDLNLARRKQLLQDKIDDDKTDLLQFQQTINGELQLKKKQLEDELALANADPSTSASAKAKNVADTNDKIAALIEEYNGKSLVTQENYIKAQLNQVEVGSAEELNLKKQQLDNQEQQEEAAAIASIKNGEELAAKLLEIQTRFGKDKETLERELNAKLFADAETQAKAEVDLANSILTGKNTAFTSTQQQQLQNNLVFAQKDLDDTEKFYADKKNRVGKSEDEINTIIINKKKDLQDAKNQLLQQELDLEKREAEVLKSIYNDVWSVAKNLNQSKADAQIQNVEDATNAEIKSIDYKLSSELISQKQHDAEIAKLNEQKALQERKIKHDSAVANKRLNLFQIIIDTAVAVIKTFREFGYPIGIPLAALQAAEGAGQAAVVASQPIPLAKGTESVTGGRKGVDSVLSLLTPEERVVPEPINRQLMGVKNMDLPRLVRLGSTVLKENNIDRLTTNNSVTVAESINYKKLAKEIGNEISKHPRSSISIDKRGITILAIEGNSETEYVNQRYFEH